MGRLSRVDYRRHRKWARTILAADVYPATRTVALELANRASRTGVVTLRPNDLIRAGLLLGLSVEEVDDAIEELIVAGWLTDIDVSARTASIHIQDQTGQK